MAPTKCTKCNKNIINKQFLICSICNKHYHLDCSSVSFQRFKIMTPANKKGYKCNACYDAPSTSRRSLSQPATPVSIHNVVDDLDNVTHRNRNRCEINISTQNSFNSLSDEEADHSLSTLSPKTDVNRSFSSLRTNYKEEINDLKQKTQYLEEKLEIAENEISNLSAENHALTKKLADYERKINQLTQICKTPRSVKKKTTSGPKHLNLSLIDSPQLLHSSSPQQQKPKSASIDCTLESKKQRTITSMDHRVMSTDGACNDKKPINQIFIIGDEQLRGLSAFLAKSHLKERSKPYKTYAHIIPEATSTEILNCCNNLKKHLTDGDVVVLGFGSYDNNMHKLHSNICIMLNKLKKASVILLPINRNPYFNELTLNYYIKLWTRHFTFCSHIDMHCFYFNDIEFRKYLLDKISLCIDYIEYKKHYLSFETIRNHNRQKQKKTEINQNDKLPKKGTIPFYFRRTCNSAQNVNETFFRA